MCLKIGLSSIEPDFSDAREYEYLTLYLQFHGGTAYIGLDLWMI